MATRAGLIIIAVGFAVTLARADDAIYRYEGDVLPHDPSAGWEVFNPCEDECAELLDGGFFVLRWETGTDFANYSFRIAQPPYAPPPYAPPPTLWVEWRFLSNHPLGQNPYCDADLLVDYQSILDKLMMFGDAVISFDGGTVLRGLAINEFRTYRFESVDGEIYCFFVDGSLFTCGAGISGNEYHSLRFSGDGGCNLDLLPTVNKWDFVRYGTISYGEQIISSDPPSGFIDAREYGPLDRFTITFDSPNYVFVDQITVQVDANEGRSDGPTGGRRDAATTATSFALQHSPFDIPQVTKTRRLDNGGPQTVEIVLDHPIPYGATTTFTFDDGVAVNIVEFTFAPGDTDGDGHADLRDFAAFQTCFGREPLSGACLALDAVTDGTIDLADYAKFQSLIRDPGP